MRYLVTTEALMSGIRATTSTGPGLDRPSIASWTPEHQPARTSALDADYRVWPTRAGSPRAMRRYVARLGRSAASLVSHPNDRYGRLRLPWTRMCCCQARAGVRLWPSQLARRHAQWRRVRRGMGHAARGPATPRRFCRRTRQQRRIRREGRLAGAAQLRLLLVGGLVLLVGDRFEPCRSVSSGDAFEHGEVAHEVSGGGAVPVFLAWRGVYFRPGKGQGSAMSTCLVAVRLPRAVPR